MKETFSGQHPKLDREDKAVIKNADLAMARAVERRRLDLVYMFKGPKHAAVKIAEGHHRYTHLTTAFAQTEYGPDELPRDPLELKVDADGITDDTLVKSTIEFLKTLPIIRQTRINIFANRKDYICKKPAVTFVPEVQVTA